MELQWPLIVFTTFVCLSAGTLGVFSVASLRNEESVRNIAMPALIVVLVELIIGGLGSVFHLQTPARYFGQFGNVASGINHEIVGLALVGIMVVIWLFLHHRHGSVHTAVKVISLIVSLVLVFVMAQSYMMASIPAWNTILLPLYYFINAFLYGVLSLQVLKAFDKTQENFQPSHVVWIALVLSALSILAYMLFFGALSSGTYTDVLHVDISTVPPVDPATIATQLLTGEHALLFWGGIVGIGLVVTALAFGILAKYKSALAVKTCLIIALIAVVIGGVCFRVALYLAGAHFFIY